ncbi:MAG: EamA family transporter RarD [Polyangiaceae bacterium]
MRSSPPSASAPGEARRGLLAAMGAFFIWGLLPLYLRPLHGIAALTIMSHRLVWCCLFVNAWLLLRRDIGGVGTALADPSTRWRLVASALLISTNWLVYVWAVGSGHVVEASLGYFINPLVNVLLGVAILGEVLRPLQWTAVACATAGVAWLTYQSGHLPWIALILAVSFGSYGLIRKTVHVESLAGLAAETTLIAPLGALWLLWEALRGPGAFGGAAGALVAWLVAGGVVTAVPLALFAFGARRIPYATVGILQYIGPSLQLAAGILVFGEPFPPARLAGFALIWSALVLYAGDGLRRRSS